jgi:acetyltransferase-like isoleucine patch superfamily enzyme
MHGVNIVRFRRKIMVDFDYGSLRACGNDVRISNNVHIKRPDLVSIGNHVAIDDYFYVSTELMIHDYVHIGPHCSIIGGVLSCCTLKDFSGVAAGCRIICGSDDYMGSGLTNPTVPAVYHADLNSDPVILEKHAILGTNCVVLPGVTIGEGASVCACSLVTRNLAPWTAYMGIPARHYKERERERILEMEAKLRKELG